MSSSAFTVSVPATSANLGPGFDTFGLALSLYNRFNFSVSASGDQLSVSEDSPHQPDLNALGPVEETLLYQSIDRVFTACGKARLSLHCELSVAIPFHSGLGSSATAIVAGVLAGNHLLDRPLSQQALLNLVTSIEGHPDNVGPALLGGVGFYCVEATYTETPHLVPQVKAYSLPWPEDWQAVVLLSDTASVNTKAARQVLPTSYPLSEAIATLRHSSLLTYAFLTRDAEALKAGLQDVLHQPYRGKALPDFEPLKAAWTGSGGYGVVISGSGPTLLGLCSNSEVDRLLHLVEEKFPQRNAKALPIDPLGATLIAT